MDQHWSSWIDRYPIKKKFVDTTPSSRFDSCEFKTKAGGKIDLHFLTQNEALEALERFIIFSYHNHRRKILVIHGKGRHSEQQQSVLKPIVIDYLHHSPYIQRLGQARARDGGSGATWAILKDIAP